MQTIKKNKGLLCSILYLVSTTLLGNTQLEVNTNFLVEKLNKIFSKQKKDQAGVSILVRKNNDVIFKLSKGLANKHKNIEINSNTGFRIGSISKSFTALAIMK